jgi:hypothetical protein
MIQDIMEQAGQYYTCFVNMPTEGKVIISVGALVILAALKNIWGLLKPVRWTAAKLLNGVAFILFPRRRKPKLKDTATMHQGIFNPPPDLDVKTVDELRNVIHHYGGKRNAKRRAELTDAQLDKIKDAYNSVEATSAQYVLDAKSRTLYLSITEEITKRDKARRVALRLGKGEPPKFDVTKRHLFKDVVRYYAGSWESAAKLTDEQLRMLIEAGKIYKHVDDNFFLKHAVAIQTARAEERKIAALVKFTQQVEETKEPNPFEKALDDKKALELKNVTMEDDVL